jgi:hypothetical protein
MNLFTIKQVAEIYVDAVVKDDSHQLLFLSAWGHDTAIQELIAKLTLPLKEGGLSNLTLYDADQKPYFVDIDQRDCLEKHSGRGAKDALFYGLTHVWIYNRTARYVDRANQRCMLLKKAEESEKQFAQRLWQAIREVSTIPLLPHWDSLIAYFRKEQWIQSFTGQGIDAVKIDLSSQDVEAFISLLVKKGELALPRKLNLAYINPAKNVLN